MSANSIYRGVLDFIRLDRNVWQTFLHNSQDEVKLICIVILLGYNEIGLVKNIAHLLEKDCFFNCSNSFLQISLSNSVSGKKTNTFLMSLNTI